MRIGYKTIFFVIVLSGLYLSSMGQYQLAHHRAQNLGPGINANRWLTRNLNNFEPWLYTEADFQQMSALGFGHVRLPVGFQNWLDASTMDVYDSLYVFIDSSLVWCLRHNLNLVIDFHPEAAEDVAILNPNNVNYAYNKVVIARFWKQTATRYQNISGNRLFYDIYNEPNFVNETQYSLFAKQVIDSIRTVDDNKTIIVEGVLTNFTFLADTNVMATIHFYNPGIFTHQGAEWGATIRNTVGVPFPYNAAQMPPLDPQDATDPFTVYQYNNYNIFGTAGYLRVLIDWNITECREEELVPVYCGEFGVSSGAPTTDKLVWIRTVREILDSLQVPWASWCWKGNGQYASFQLFDCNYCIDGDSVVTDSLNYTQLCALGISNTCPTGGVITRTTSSAESGWSIFPNPGSGAIYTSSTETLHAVVFDIFGRCLKKTIFSSEHPIDLSAFPNGVYHLSIFSGSKYMTKSWVKQ